MSEAVGNSCFIPLNECTVASGDCFQEGRCLMKCRPRYRSLDQANRELGEALRLLKQLVAFVEVSRPHSQYVDKSTVDIAVNQAKALMSNHN